MSSQTYHIGSINNDIIVEIDEYGYVESIDIEEGSFYFNGMRLLEILPIKMQELILKEIAEIALTQI